MCLYHMEFHHSEQIFWFDYFVEFYFRRYDCFSFMGGCRSLFAFKQVRSFNLSLEGLRTWCHLLVKIIVHVDDSNATFDDCQSLPATFSLEQCLFLASPMEANQVQSLCLTSLDAQNFMYRFDGRQLNFIEKVLLVPQQLLIVLFPLYAHF